MRTQKNILFSTFIGLAVGVVNSSSSGFIGIKGTVVDETKNLLVVETGDGSEKRIPKVACTFRFTLDDGKTTDVEGTRIMFRPEERAKKV